MAQAKAGSQFGALEIAKFLSADYVERLAEVMDDYVGACTGDRAIFVAVKAVRPVLDQR